MKKIVVILLCIFCISSMFSGCANSGSSISNKANAESDFEWQYTDYGVEITRYIGKRCDVVIPETLDNKIVVSLGKAFIGNISLTSIVLPETIDKLDLDWFINCTSLERIEALGAEKIYNTADLPTLTHLILPNLYLWNFNYSARHMPSLEYLYIPRVSTFDCTDWGGECADSGTIWGSWSDSLKEVVIRDDLWASTGYEFEFYITNIPYVPIGDLRTETELEIDSRYKQNNPDYYEKITKENAAFIYCNFFQKDTIIVNGEKYSLDT